MRTLSSRLQNLDSNEHQWCRSGESEFSCLISESRVSEDTVWVEDLHKQLTKKLKMGSIVVRPKVSLSVSYIENSELVHANLLWNHLSNARLAAPEFEPPEQWLPQYHPSMKNMLSDQNDLINRISEGLAQNQFVPFYQLKVDAQTGDICSIEVLARWKLSDGSYESPGVFIPAAEASGLIVRLTYSLFDQVLIDIKRWCSAGLHVGRVAINVAGEVMHHTELMSRLEQLNNSLPNLCDGLEIEITENIALGDNVDRTNKVLNDIRGLGIHVAIDDFGTGYASLQTLIDMPFDVLKIDRSFVIPLTESGDGHEIVSAMISLCNTLKKHCVVEGIETEWQWKLLAQMGADELQGFYFYKPVEAMEVERIIANSYGAKKAA